jgi:hypothetical protein
LQDVAAAERGFVRAEMSVPKVPTLSFLACACMRAVAGIDAAVTARLLLGCLLACGRVTRARTTYVLGVEALHTFATLGLHRHRSFHNFCHHGNQNLHRRATAEVAACSKKHTREAKSDRFERVQLVTSIDRRPSARCRLDRSFRRLRFSRSFG